MTLSIGRHQPPAPGTAPARHRTPAPDTDLEERDAASPRPARPLGRPAVFLRRGIRVLLPVTVVAAAAWVLPGRLPAPGQVLQALRQAHVPTLMGCFAEAVTGVGMFARQHRSLARAHGIPLRPWHAWGLAWARTAMTAALPAGSALSAAYAFQRFRHHGGDRLMAASATLVSGVLSAVGLALLFLLGTAVAALADPGALAGAGGALGTGAALLACFAAVLWAGVTLARREQGEDGSPPRTRPAAALAKAGGAVLAVTRLPRGDALAALAFATGSWLADLATLYTAALAFGLDVHPLRLAVLYLGAQLLRQIPLTPGGIGVIETSLITGLVTLGAAAAPATAAVMVYRLLTCWLPLPVGAASWLLLHRST
ncbi:YbhN family protein [Streptosporangium sp. NPDC051022]|uniref:lysylphosphatidylglycerol synthase transmembrane domain-containing protein n=1 Tax=Streptosporangium sp. NPDC051022 TaxID=3155752 RepID=UPI00341B6B24